MSEESSGIEGGFSSGRSIEGGFSPAAANCNGEDYIALDFEKNSLLYALKTHNPERNLYCSNVSPASMKEHVLSSPRIKQVIREITDENLARSMESARSTAQSILDEIAHKMSLPAVRTLAGILRSVFTKILSAIYVNKDGIDILAHTVTKWPVVLLPSHRSYLDFILVTYIMFEYNITLPCIAAGQDFMSMRGVSPLLRRSGAFFLRRTFGSDKLYKAVFSEYVKEALCSGDFPMEFFLEGTRSRTGKSLHPKLGLLSTVIEPYLEGRLPDIMLVPISISYERTLEELLFAKELLGVPKPKESTTALVKAHSILTENYGSIICHIGTPISVHEVCQHLRIPHSMLPREQSELFSEDWSVVKTIGTIVLDRIHSGMKVFPTSVVATALLQQLEGIQWEKLVKQVKWIERQVHLRGGQTANLECDHNVMVSSALQLLSSSIHVTRDKVVCIATATLSASLHQHLQPVSLPQIFMCKLEESEFKELSDVAFAHLHLAHYRNQLLHLFVEDAMLALCLDRESDYETVWSKYSVLHQAIASEFVLPQKPPRKLLDSGLKRFLSLGLLFEACEVGGKLVFHHQQSHLMHFGFLRTLLLPFVSGVWVVCSHLLSLNDGVQSLSAAVRAAQWLSAKCLKQGLFTSFEVLSLGLIKNAISSLHQAGLILQASNEFGTGKDRLVKVIKKEKLINFTSILGAIVLPQANPVNSKL